MPQNASAVANFEEAVRAGDVTWHAYPFNAEPEVGGVHLFVSLKNAFILAFQACITIIHDINNNT